MPVPEGDIRYQPAFPGILGDRDPHLFGDDRDVAGEDGDDLVLDDFQQPGGEVAAIVDQDDLKALFGGLPG